MKRLFATTAIVLVTLSGAAFAGAPLSTDASLTSFLTQYGVTVPASSVTAAERDRLATIQTEPGRTDAQIRSEILSVLGAQAGMTGMTATVYKVDAQLIERDQTLLNQYGYKVDAAKLPSDQQVALSFIKTGDSQTEGQVKAKIDSVIGTSGERMAMADGKPMTPAVSHEAILIAQSVLDQHHVKVDAATLTPAQIAALGFVGSDKDGFSGVQSILMM